MNTKFTAAAQAIADHFKAAEAARGEPFRDTFTNPMNNDAVTPNFVGIPLALLRALVAAAGPIASDASHPMQPILLDDNGTPRFMRNAIVEHLAQDKLNELAKMGFCSEDRMQLAQLIGYSVSGYGGLSYVCSESANEADKIAATLVADKGGAA